MAYKLSTEEERLLFECKQNDPRAQRQLYNKYKDAMYTLVIRLLSNLDEAKEALQDGFIEVFKSIQGFRGESTLGAWIKVIVIRAALRHAKSITFTEQSLTERTDAPIIWDENLTGEVLQRAIVRLPPGCKAVFVMVEIEGYSHKETAELLGISEGTSKSQLFYAKKTLQKSLKELIEH